MRRNLPVTQNEYDYPADWILLSTTDTQSIIKYANASFCKVAGYDVEELTGNPHNMVRHPDMPEAAFADLWKNIQKGDPWKGLVKNRCSNGDYYWVDAFVTPITHNGEVVEYQSVRTKPSREQVARAEKIYTDLNSGKTASTSPSKLGLPLKVSIVFMLTMLPMLYVASEVGSMGYGIFALSFIAGLTGINFAFSRFRSLVSKAENIYDNQVASSIYTGKNDDISKIDLALQMQASELKAVLGRTLDSSEQTSANAMVSAAKGEEVQGNSEAQMAEIEQVATAMQEMTATLTDMASNCSDAAQASEKALQETSTGDEVVTKVISSIEDMASQLTQTSDVITELEEHSKGIGSVLDVIQGIAEQTNLLALNAAIEAARAGEQGRGFAVVADEVRSLAQRTHESTTEIHNMITRLQEGTGSAVNSMHQGVKAAEICVDQAEQAGLALTGIRSSVETITDMTHHIASAVEEQSSVSGEVNRNVVNVSQLVNSSNVLGQDMVELNQNVIEKIDSQKALVEQFLKRSFKATT
ncbi:methyl-accepting chemotaxis protein [Shewanella gelidii]|uniref:Chemotaxis protein n=1 Tax=Shewanella gelidii TaxID=1642821 RepID=A0A917JQW3_9GAMM|nr:PAS domain-containing methyl-accepting chemotaxis protein [Shewanella gelidii]MCL1097731.1 methyl-accepting chemotaxis protein [Shewanella gelidii]GGI79237.1 chemotaxis protein [Shewanella gelidii]